MLNAPPAPQIVVPPQIPWYRNAVVWSTYAVQAGGALLALAGYVQTIPGLPHWIPLVAGGVIVVLTQLGYQSHSAAVRVAELAAAPAPLASSVDVTPVVDAPAPGPATNGVVPPA